MNNKEFLIASHIKPWRFSGPSERTDENNGLLLCPNHDSLFDKGYISFREDGQIIISERLDDEDKQRLNINTEIKIDLNDENQRYVKFHRDLFGYE